ncbi:MAG TPA: HAMP domain-containing sensor histidine kinase [Gemmatimonadaceae bacterium]
MRRGQPEVFVAILILLVLGSYVWYTQRVVATWREDATRATQMYGLVFRAFGDTTRGGSTAALLELSRDIREEGVPLILVDPEGVIAGHANLPFETPDKPVSNDDPRVRAYIPVLEGQHPPIIDSLVGRIYFGDSAGVRGLRIIPVVQAITVLILLVAGLFLIRARGDATRERIWAGMARESAHQLGTPLSSLEGWIELLEERAAEEGTETPVRHMRADLERLDRVAHRFERIGRDPQLETVNIGDIVERTARYFRARVPTLANTIMVEASIAENLPSVRGDAVLLEWAVEVLTKNAIDALAGRGGRVRLSAERARHGGVTVRVADDGPGIPRDLRGRVFDPGFSTKKGGWGIGLSLAKRIVEENHGGKLMLLNSDHGATFEIVLS